MKKIKISPSILSADFSQLGNEIKKLETAGADMVHVDVMDGHFVPNLTIGPPVIKALRKYTSLPFDVHLMISPVHKYIKDYADAGADIITFHPEATDHIDRTISLIMEHKCKPGIVFNPATPLTYLEHCIEKVDMILLMSVNPGFPGQKFIESTYEKIKKVREIIDKSGRKIRLEVDGGINLENIANVAEAGADTFVAGSAIFNSDDYKSTISQMRSVLSKI